MYTLIPVICEGIYFIEMVKLCAQIIKVYNKVQREMMSGTARYVVVDAQIRTEKTQEAQHM